MGTDGPVHKRTDNDTTERLCRRGTKRGGDKWAAPSGRARLFGVLVRWTRDGRVCYDQAFPVGKARGEGVTRAVTERSTMSGGIV